MNSNKEKYQKLCTAEPSIPIFSQDWWLDAAAGSSNWDVALVENRDNIIACMPYVKTKRAGLKISTVPPLTYCLGPWVRPVTAKNVNCISRQKEVLESLIEQLPTFDHFKQQWHYSQTNWLPFYWRGFEQTTQYTYVIGLQTDAGSTWQGLHESTRREIRKAMGRGGLCVRDDLSVDEFLPLHRKVYERQNMSMPYSEDVVRVLDNACAGRNRRKIFIAEDPQGARHAGVYLIWDDTSAYYLMGGSDPEWRNSGAMSLCMWEAIKFASATTERFDFCGSMIKSVERFVQAFGGMQTPYFAVSKTSSKLAASMLFVRSLTNAHAAR
ncbi:methicillin resistance protein [Pollutimonas nitritireducens]|uniref:Methicillin resistance protein n=1 Tax=Pollutimonas nitritireducens TaxID=2045209 RepID=A0A2N4UD93_9BURK|nr:GNAT family N-acetyltransferase [Pollutimonas nitritireducens]PLC52989.1 methicillin resistance protein [Pollutimonas nitritireducens]